MTATLRRNAAPAGVLDDALLHRAVRTFPLSRRLDVHFADAELILRSGSMRTALGASALTIGRFLAIAKCRSELVERWAHHLWVRGGSPALVATGMCSGTASVLDGPVPAVRADATGLCAGPWQQRASVAMHGLLEALERDAVTGVLDEGDGIVRPAHVLPPPAYVTLARRWNGSIHLFTVDRCGLPPTALAVFVTEGAHAGAIGAACRVTESDACAHAIEEALMMFTTARHWTRQASVPDAYAGIVWASKHIAQLLDELRQPALRPSPPAGGPGPGPDQIAAAVRDHFQSEPLCAELPVPHASLDGTGVWWVSIPGARTPATATRSPWPFG
jgi:hypothetical protein